ncbi:MAG: DUF4112 domain-containing protein [Verrucomicrobiales bacterium]|nr:DUF4112 domain-containing protein [Verrucomicrobiales bacterium]
MSDDLLPAELDDGEVNPIYEAVRRKAERDGPDSKASKAMAWLLDECIRIPGTNFRIGLDPIIGLIPGGGETVSTILGAVVLGQAGNRGIPFKSLVKMGGNMLLNAGVGALPVVGDAFSAWFKSNSRNYQMLREYLDNEEGGEARGGWWPIFFILFIIFVVLAINIGSGILTLFLIAWAMSQAGIGG